MDMITALPVFGANEYFMATGTVLHPYTLDAYSPILARDDETSFASASTREAR